MPGMPASKKNDEVYILRGKDRGKTGRVLIVGSVLAAAGFVMGCAFPLGVRNVAPTGEWAIQKMWAINGAASIAASVLAAVIGLGWGSGAVLIGGILAYGLALAGAILSYKS